MAGFSSWSDGNWFNLIQTAGIVGSLLFGAATAQREAKTREIENHLTIAEQHRNLWNEARQRKDLDRIFQTDADVIKIPITVAESEFLNLVVGHFQAGWILSENGAAITLNEMRADVRDFFTLPLPRAVWERTKGMRNRRFVKFVERALQ
jgi:hypothetical protein